MERIMSLNRNLTEESLKTLLSASGWDREDIMEGLRIFRNKNKNTVVATPIKSLEVNTNNEIEDNAIEKSEDEKYSENITNNVYSFNLKKKEAENVSNSSAVKTEDVISSNITKDNSTITTNSINIFPGNNKRKDEKEEDKSLSQNDFLTQAPISNDIKTTEIEKNKNKGGFGKALFYVLLILILGILSAYILIPKFNSYVNQRFFSTTILEPIISENEKQNNISQNNFPNNNISTNPNINPNNNQSVNPNPNVSNIDIEELRKEIINLKSELEKYKTSTSEEKTVIKYISQRGPAGIAGKNGRGITTVDATTTGFLINYTDGTKDIVPYSTTTILNILNSESVCFRDASSTPNIVNTSNPDICLDRNSLLNLINRR